MALTSSMFVGSEGRERGNEVRRDEDGCITFFTQERLAISIMEEETLHGDLTPQLRGLTRVGSAEASRHRGQGSARDAPPTPYWYLGPGAQQQRLAETPPSQGGHLPRETVQRRGHPLR